MRSCSPRCFGGVSLFWPIRAQGRRPMNTKSLSEIKPVFPAIPNWDKMLPVFSDAFPDKQFYLDEDRQELRIGHTLVIQPAWGIGPDQFCYVDKTGQGWCPTGEEDVYVEAGSQPQPSWRIGWLEPFQATSYAWRMVPTCIYTDTDLIRQLNIILPMVVSIWDMLAEYHVKPPKSDDEVVGLLWVGID